MEWARADLGKCRSHTSILSYCSYSLLDRATTLGRSLSLLSFDYRSFHSSSSEYAEGSSPRGWNDALSEPQGPPSIFRLSIGSLSQDGSSGSIYGNFSGQQNCSLSIHDGILIRQSGGNISFPLARSCFSRLCFCS